MGMNDVLKYLANVRTLLNAPVIRQLTLMLGLAGGVALGITLYNSIQDPLYRPLDYQLNSDNMAQIVDTLNKANIQYKINDKEQLIYVAAEDMSKARMKLSSSGIAKDDVMNFNYLKDQSGLGNSQFLENARYLRALEGDLSRTISSIEGVSSARVHVAIPQNNIFADEHTKPTASIVLSIVPGLSSDKEKVRAIVQIVASSVPGLDPKDVAITDQYGHYLTTDMDPDALYNAEQLAYQSNLQNYYEKRIQSMIIPLIGENKVSVRVHAEIDFTQQEEAKEEYDPSQKVLRSEQSISEQSGGGASGVPGSLSNTPSSSEGDKSGSKSGGGKNESIKNYELGKSVTYKKSNHAKITNLSVAVVVDNDSEFDAKTKKWVSKPIPADKISKITDLVKATIGYDSKRGDQVTVVNSSFIPVKDMPPPPPIPLWNQAWFWDLVKKCAGIGVGFIFLALIYRRLMSMIKAAAEPGKNNGSLMGIGGSSELSPEMEELKKEQIKRLKELTTRDPSRVALVLKNWVGK